jgi:hypothetical protein
LDYIDQQHESYPRDVRIRAFKYVADRVKTNMPESEVMQIIGWSWTRAVEENSPILVQDEANPTAFVPLDSKKS